MSTLPDDAKVIQFPGRWKLRPGAPADEHAKLAGDMAEGIRNYRNRFGVDDARRSLASQAFVLGIITDAQLTALLESTMEG